MKVFKTKNRLKNTVNKWIFIVFFLVIINSILLVLYYGNKIYPSISVLIDQKTNKVLFQFFNDLIKYDVIESENDLFNITKNTKGEILMVDYDIKKTYKILNNVSNILKKGINDLENGKIDIKAYDKYLSNNKNGLILNIPLFLNSKNVFINNLGPRIPVSVNLNETLLTNIKTKVTNYGFNNALLEIYITVEMQKLVITPIKKYEDKLSYDILVDALVINGSVPNFYGGLYEKNSNVLDIPLN